MAELRLQICGPVSVEQGDVLVPERELPGRQGRRLLAYLVLNRERAVARDELATALWGDDIPDAWDASLNALASRLRASLRRIVGLGIRSGVGWYALGLGEASIDFERCWRAVLRAEAHLRERDLAAALMETLIARAIAQRGFLPGESGTWIESNRRVLADTLVQATELAGEVELARGSASGAHRMGRELVALDPLRESGYRLLMRALAASGNAAQALRIMEECRLALREIADAAPSPETERVFREVSRTGR